MSGDTVMTWRCGGVSLELRGDFALLPEHCQDLAPITAALDEFAHKHGFAGPVDRALQSRRVAVVHEVEVGDRVRVVTCGSKHEGRTGKVEVTVAGWLVVQFLNDDVGSFRPADLEWVGP